MNPTAIFCEQVHKVWGNPKQVADAAFAELFRHRDEISLDYDDQVSHAIQVGVLAGTMQDSGPDDFIKAFTDKVLNG